jgi:uncharacterized protein involved in outer membrane biogenesis
MTAAENAPKNKQRCPGRPAGGFIMKKWLFRIGLAVVALFIVVVAVVVIFLDAIVKKEVETAGPRITQVEVKLDKASISLLGGSVELKGLFVGNPPGYTSECAMKIGDVSVSLKPASVWSDRIVIRSIQVKSAEITVEGGLRENNLTKIESNVNGAPGGSSSGAAKKLQVGDLTVSGAILRVKSPLLAGKVVSVPLPDIHLTDLGNGADGVTAAELTQKVLRALMKEIVPAATKALNNAGAAALRLGKNAEKQGQDALKKAGSGLKSLIGQ